MSVQVLAIVSTTGYVTFCEKCMAVLSYNNTDIKIFQDSDGPGGNGSLCKYIECPICKIAIYL